jgi:hypothetical protein
VLFHEQQNLNGRHGRKNSHGTGSEYAQKDYWLCNQLTKSNQVPQYALCINVGTIPAYMK